MGTGLCPDCLFEGEMINEHEDGQHEEPVDGCPYCKAEQEETKTSRVDDSPENVHEEMLAKDKEAGLS